MTLLGPGRAFCELKAQKENVCKGIKVQLLDMISKLTYFPFSICKKWIRGKNLGDLTDSYRNHGAINNGGSINLF